METTPSFATLREIRNQPAAWRSTIDTVSQMWPQIAAYQQRALAANLPFCGCGSPYYLSLAASTAYRHATGRQASAHPASNIWLFPESHLTGGEQLLVCVSRSGETTEILRAIDQFRRRTRGAVLAITCDGASAIAQLADLTIPLPAAQEVSVAQTQSFTSMLVACLMAAAAWSEDGSQSAFADLPDACDSLLLSYYDLARHVGRDVDGIERIFVLGSDALYGIACEAMLKLKEMSLTYAEAFHFLEFRHGPKAMVNERSLVIGLVSQTAATPESQVLREMRGMGARVLAVSPVELAPDTYDDLVYLPQSMTGIARIPLYLPIAQLIAYHRTRAKGLDPDNPTNLTAFVHLGDPADNSST